MSARPYLAVLILIIATGCARPPSQVPPPPLVKLEGGVNDPVLDVDAAPAGLKKRVESLLLTGRNGACRRQVQLRPDLALRFLQDFDAKSVDQIDLIIARSHDQQVGGEGGGWAAWLEDRREHPERYTAWDEDVLAFREKVRAGRAGEALAALPSNPPDEGPAQLLLSIQHARMTGGALLECGRWRESATTLRQGVTLARRTRPYEAARLNLLLASAETAAGDPAAAASAWDEAVTGMAILLDSAGAILDPAFWLAATRSRPTDHSWPQPATVILARTWQRVDGVDGEPETSALALAGHHLLRRDESRAALLAFATASARPGLAHAAVDRLRLGQARALVLQRELGGARALLSTLVETARPATARPAEALLAGLELWAGHPGEAAAMLSPLLASSEQWSERSAAEANFGLAQLLLGQTEQGFALLHAAQQGFARAGDQEALVQSLENELSWYRQQGDTTAAQRTAARLDGENAR